MANEHAPSGALDTLCALITDPYPLERGAVSALLRRSGVAHCVHETAPGGEALKAARRHRVDLVVLGADADRPHSLLRWCRRLKELPAAPTVVVYSATSDPSVVTACLANRADGFVHRSATAEQLVEAVRSVVAKRPMWLLGDPPSERGADGAPVAAFPGMTQREQEIFALLTMRYANDEIAAELHLAHQTVKNHVSSVLHKTGFANRRELAKLRHAGDTTEDTGGVVLCPNQLTY